MLSLAAALLSASLLPSRAAEQCTPGVAGVATACDAATDLAQGLAQRRVDRTLATDPVSNRAGRLDGATAPQGGDVVPLFAMTADGDNTNFKTSLTQWGSAFSAADQETLKDLQTAIGQDAALPRTMKPKPQFDIWAQGRRELFVDNGAVQGSAITTYLGADYRWRNDLLIGGMVQLDDSRRSILASPDAAEGAAFMAGPYLAYRLTPNVRLDAKAAWGTAHDSAVSGAESLDLAADRMLTEAKLSGHWGWHAWQLSQSGALTYIDETSLSGIPGTGATSLDITRLTVGPELKRHIDTGNGASIEPFAFFKSSLSLADPAWGTPVTQNTVGGGFTLAKPDTYHIRAMADFTETTDSADEVATGKVLVTVPSSLLGF
jgi:hypothetical protein